MCVSVRVCFSAWLRPANQHRCTQQRHNGGNYSNVNPLNLAVPCRARPNRLGSASSYAVFFCCSCVCVFRSAQPVLMCMSLWPRQLAAQIRAKLVLSRRFRDGIHATPSRVSCEVHMRVCVRVCECRRRRRQYAKPMPTMAGSRSAFASNGLRWHSMRRGGAEPKRKGCAFVLSPPAFGVCVVFDENVG